MVTTEFIKLRASIGDSGGWISSVVLHKNNTLTVCCSVSFFKNLSNTCILVPKNAVYVSKEG